LDPGQPGQISKSVPENIQFHLLKNKVTTPGGGLPPVFPIVLYNGSQRWTAEQDVYEMVQPKPPAFLKVGDGFEIRPRFRSAAASHTFVIT
jgi:hypothetical protein